MSLASDARSTVRPCPGLAWVGASSPGTGSDDGSGIEHLDPVLVEKIYAQVEASLLLYLQVIGDDLDPCLVGSKQYEILITRLDANGEPIKP